MKRLFKKIKRFLSECKITLKLLKIPTKEEFKTIVKVTALGTLIIGSVGFIIRVIVYYLFNV